MTPQAAGLALLVLAGGTAFYISSGEKRLQSFFKGAAGEEQVARMLTFLPAEFRVFHGVGAVEAGWTGAADYDHVVIGPAGIFVIETKNWRGRIEIADGRILCGGRAPDRDPIEQVKRAAAGLQRVLTERTGLDLPVRPLLCFVAGSLPADRCGAAGVEVCTSEILPKVLSKPGERHLSPGEVQRAAEAVSGLLEKA